MLALVFSFRAIVSLASIAALIDTQVGGATASTAQVAGFYCANRYNKSLIHRINIDLNNAKWQDEDGTWYPIHASTANSLRLRDDENKNGRQIYVLNRFSLELEETTMIIGTAQIVALDYQCKIVPPIDMKLGRKF